MRARVPRSLASRRRRRRSAPGRRSFIASVRCVPNTVHTHCSKSARTHHTHTHTHTHARNTSKSRERRRRKRQRRRTKESRQQRDDRGRARPLPCFWAARGHCKSCDGRSAHPLVIGVRRPAPCGLRAHAPASRGGGAGVELEGQEQEDAAPHQQQPPRPLSSRRSSLISSNLSSTSTSGRGHQRRRHPQLARPRRPFLYVGHAAAARTLGPAAHLGRRPRPRRIPARHLLTPSSRLVPRLDALPQARRQRRVLVR